MSPLDAITGWDDQPHKVAIQLAIASSKKVAFEIPGCSLTQCKTAPPLGSKAPVSCLQSEQGTPGSAWLVCCRRTWRLMYTAVSQ